MCAHVSVSVSASVSVYAFGWVFYAKEILFCDDNRVASFFSFFFSFFSKEKGTKRE